MISVLMELKRSVGVRGASDALYNGALGAETFDFRASCKFEGYREHGRGVIKEPHVATARKARGAIPWYTMMITSLARYRCQHNSRFRLQRRFCMKGR